MASVAQQTESESADLVSITLKTLIRFNQYAAFIKLRPRDIRAQQAGTYLSRLKGRGMEFDEARLYQPGDDIRTIDWRVTARTGKAHTKLYREERERPVFISVDYRPAMWFATRGVFKSVQAAKLAGLLAWAASYHGDKVGGQVFSRGHCREIKPLHSQRAVMQFLHYLVEKPSEENSNTMAFNQVIDRLRRHARPGSLVYLISDFRQFDNVIEKQLRTLSKHCEVVMIHIYDPLEYQLPSKGRYRLTNNHKDVVFDAANELKKEQFHRQSKQHVQDLQKFARGVGMTLLQCATNDDPVKLLTR
ncbi:MAG: DUF58 domain-containing protein [Methylococcaceae bacterium]